MQKQEENTFIQKQRILASLMHNQESGKRTDVPKSENVRSKNESIQMINELFKKTDSKQKEQAKINARRFINDSDKTIIGDNSKDPRDDINHQVKNYIDNMIRK